MSIEMTAPSSRRALLAAALGAGAATIASAIGRPLPVRAADGDVVYVGGDYAASSRTAFDTGSTGATALMGQCDTGSEPAVFGINPSGPGVNGQSTSGPGVLGESISGNGVAGFSEAGEGVVGGSTTGAGVEGGSTSGTGVQGMSESGEGVAGSSTSHIGVSGECATGFGVHGSSDSGVGVVAVSKSGKALDVVGKAMFSRSGRVRIAAGKRSVDVDLRAKGGLAGTPLCFANLLYYRSGVYVAAVRPNYPSTGKLRIYLNKAVTASTNVAWAVLN
jgi:hypothetical protein